jgi:hypothetical protein
MKPVATRGVCHSAGRDLPPATQSTEMFVSWWCRLLWQKALGSSVSMDGLPPKKEPFCQHTAAETGNLRPPTRRGFVVLAAAAPRQKTKRFIRARPHQPHESAPSKRRDACAAQLAAGNNRKLPKAKRLGGTSWLIWTHETMLLDRKSSESFVASWPRRSKVFVQGICQGLVAEKRGVLHSGRQQYHSVSPSWLSDEIRH